MKHIQPRTLGWLCFIILIGFAFRVYNLDAVSFRGDEAFTAQYWVDYPLSKSLSEIIQIEPFPPLGYIVYRVWGLLTLADTTFGLRYFSVITNILGSAVMFALGRRLAGDRVGLIATVLWTFNPFFIWHAQDFRMYALWATLTLLNLWLAMITVQRRQMVDYALYFLVALSSVMIFYFEAITLLVLGIFVTISRRHEPKFVLKWLGMNAIIALATVISFIYFQGDLLGPDGYGGLGQNFDPAEIFTRLIPTLIFGSTLPAYTLYDISFVLSGAILMALVMVWYKSWRNGLLLSLLSTLPMILLLIVADSLNAVDARYILNATPAFLLLFAITLGMLANFRHRIKWLIIGIMAVSYITVTGASLVNHYANPLFAKSHDWRAITDYLEETVSNNDVVIQTAADAAFGYYYSAPAAERAIPGLITQGEDEILAELNLIQDEFESFWIIAESGQDWPNAHVLPDWLATNRQLVRQTKIAGIPVREYRRWAVVSDEIATPIDTKLGDITTLAGTTSPVIPQAMENWPIWLYWQPEANTDRPHKVFIHVIRESDNQIVAQSDLEPQNGRTPTTIWNEQTIIRDVHFLDMTGLKPDNYRVIVGLYDPETGDRLHTPTDDDHIVIKTFTID